MLDFLKPKGMTPTIPQVATSTSKVSDCYNIYQNKAPWVDGEVVKSLNLARTIVKEVRKTALSEFEYSVEMVSQNTTELNRVLSDLRNNEVNIVTNLLVGGKVLIKPYMINTIVGLSVVKALDYKAKYYENGELRDVVISSKYSHNNETYTLYEKHEYIRELKTYTISYNLYKHDNHGNGKPAPLSDIPELANIEPMLIFEGVESHLCTEGEIEDCIFYDAIDLIKDADKQYSSIDWEYTAGEMAIDVSADLLKKPGSSNLSTTTYDLPKGKERLYRKMIGANQEFGMEHWAPELRDESYWRGLEKILRRIEFACGLSYGILSENSEVAKTATEIIASKQRFYVTISTIQTVYKEIIENTLHNATMMAQLVTPSFVNFNKTLEFSIDDNILTSRQEKVDERLKLVEKGIWTVEEFKDWYKDM